MTVSTGCRFLLAGLVALAGPGLARRFAAADGQERPKAEAPRLVEYYHSFKDNPDARRGWEPLGPNAEEYAQFEPAGLRISLPAGWGGERPSTGVRRPIGVKGDFEITASFELLKEP